MRRVAGPVTAVWACFLVRLFFYCSVIPLWEGFDEYAHFAYVRTLVSNGSIPHRDTPVPGDVVTSLRLAPLPWTLRDYFPSVPHLTHDAWWRLPEEDRARRQQALRLLGSGQAHAGESAAVLEYEAQQPPLYYAIMALPCYLARERSLLEQVWLLRLLSAALASLAIPGAYFLGRAVFGRADYGVATAALVTAMPGLMITLARVSNEALAVVLGTALLLVIVRRKESPLLLGGIVGLALLTKAYFLTTALAVAVWLGFRAWRSRSIVAAGRLVGVMAAAGVIAGWWYWAIWRATGSLSGEQHDVAVHARGYGAFLHVLGSVHWLQALDSTFCSHIWMGGWSFLGVRGWMYHFFAAVALIAAMGVVRAAISGAPAVRLLVLIFAAFAAGLAYHAAATFLVSGISATTGWYIYSLAAGEAVLFPLGLMTFIPLQRRGYAFPALCLAFLALEIFATHIYLLPYYAGLVAHVPGAGVNALRLSQLGGGGWWMMIERLAVNKPAWLSPWALAGLWSGYLAAFLAPVYVAWKAAR